MTSRPRIKAAVIAAPAIGYAFTKDAPASPTTRVQQWRAENDQVTPNPWKADIVRDNLLKPPADHLVASAGVDCLAPCVDARTSASSFDGTAFHADINKALVAFFGTQLTTSSP
jgi:predicted dienelactone hydrolase